MSVVRRCSLLRDACCREVSAVGRRPLLGNVYCRGVSAVGRCCYKKVSAVRLLPKHDTTSFAAGANCLALVWKCLLLTGWDLCMVYCLVNYYGQKAENKRHQTAL